MSPQRQESRKKSAKKSGKKNGAEKSSVRTIPAAGAVLYRMDGKQKLCAIVHRPRYDDWSLPKGKVDPGESLPTTAIREILEETGFTSVLEQRLACTSYPLKEHSRKEVTYWRAQVAGGSFVPNSEVDQLRWLPAEEASQAVSYPLDRKVLSRFQSTPEISSTLLLVRHARAGSRAEWSGKDRDRPLDKTGRVQAELLAPVLHAFGARRVYSAPPVRCMQTVAPASEALGVDTIMSDALSDGTFESDPEAMSSFLREVVDGEGSAAACSQGTAIPGTLRALSRGSKVSIEDPSTKKAALWVLGFDHSDLVFADYYSSPLPAR